MSLQACEHSSVPTARPPMQCLGQLMGPPCVAGQWQEQFPLGTTDFTLQDKASSPAPLHQTLPVMQAAHERCWGKGDKGDNDIEAGALLAPSKARNTPWSDPMIAEGDSGVDELALWPFTNQVLWVRCSSLQDSARHSPAGAGWWTLSHSSHPTSVTTCPRH